MFEVYTLFYFILLYTNLTVDVVAPSLLIIVSAFREFYLIIVFLYFLLSITQRKTIFFTAENVLLTICIILAVPYILISGNKGCAISTFLVYYSGPLLFLFITNIKFSSISIKNYSYFLRKLLLLLCIGSLVLFPFQNTIVDIFGEKRFKLFYLTDGSMKMRLFGLGFHPTTTGFLCIYTASMFFIINKKIIPTSICLFTQNLAHTRSALFGIPVYILFRIKSKLVKILFVILGIVGSICIFFAFTHNYLNKYIDFSAMVHFLHLFVDGPEAVIKYAQGIGLGMVSPYNLDNPLLHLESDFYLYAIQVGIHNLIFFLIAICFIIRKLVKQKNVKANYLLFIFSTFLMGCIFFPLHSMRFISNFVWIELGFYFSDLNFANKRSIQL